MEARDEEGTHLNFHPQTCSGPFPLTLHRHYQTYTADVVGFILSIKINMPQSILMEVNHVNPNAKLGLR